MGPRPRSFTNITSCSSFGKSGKQAPCLSLSHTTNRVTAISRNDTIDMRRIKFLVTVAAAMLLLSGVYGLELDDDEVRNLQVCGDNEQACMRCSYAADGGPLPAELCPIEVCCDIQTEEKCYDEKTGDPTSCIRYDEGGCPCPPGEAKCGASEYSSGYCTSLCCDWSTEWTCYDSNREPLFCKKYEDGPCHTEEEEMNEYESIEEQAQQQFTVYPLSNSESPSISIQPSSAPSSLPSSQPSTESQAVRFVRRRRHDGQHNSLFE